MKRRRHIASPVATVALLAGLATGGPSAAADQLAFSVPNPLGAVQNRRVALDYAIYIGGFRMIDIALKARLDRADYRIGMDLKAVGFLNTIIDWEMTAWSEGSFESRRVVPVRAGHNSEWRGKHRRIRLDWSRGDGPPVVETVPKGGGDERSIVKEQDRIGVRDLAGAILSTLISVGIKDSCTHAEPVFDGRRRFDMKFEEVGRDRLEKTDFSPYEGEALRCSLEIERISGFRLRQSRYRWMSGGNRATVWLGRALPDAPPVLMRLEVETVFGPLRLHLVKAALDNGGVTLPAQQSKFHGKSGNSD
jgi:hypothetical protein